MIQKNKFRVFVGEGPIDNSGDLIVFKGKDKWNDFTFYTRYSCNIYINAVLRHSMDVFVGVYDSKNKATGLGNIMSGAVSMELNYTKNNIRFFLCLEILRSIELWLESFLYMRRMKF